MGYVPSDEDVKMCNNPQKSWRLGWYEDQTLSIDPLVGTDNREFVLDGISDYKKNNDALVVLRLEQSSMIT
jgi:hypothetical protein